MPPLAAEHEPAVPEVDGADEADDADDDDGYERTQLSVRKRELWQLVTKDGDIYPVPGVEFTVGRAGAKAPGSGAVGIADVTKTISKAHARFTMINGAWFVEDLSSTNGTALVDAAGREVDVVPGTPVQVTGALLLGDVEFTLRRAGESG